MKKNPAKKILSILNDPEFSQMNKSNLLGFLGEIYVKEKLIGEGFEVQHKGNQSPVDLIINNAGEVVNIDVKLSSRKYHNRRKRGKHHFHWGWALTRSTKTKSISATHYVCVALNDEYLPQAYYIVRASDLNKFPGDNGQFTHVSASLLIAENFGDFKTHGGFIKCHELLKSEVIKKISPSKKLGALLK